ncbi:MAG TPA: pirin family protein [Candidatus Limnocylindria bacterium]|nr:pirin family protein [Candidatus Limnocylindria bacterium]
MIELRPADSIHAANGGWFQARWHFSFADYRDPANMGFGDLRVFNDDRLIPGAVWPMHPHRDIEGITYVAEGTFEHADSLGNGGVLLPGSVQRATLGSGMEHSERNHSQTEPLRFIQMWIMPAVRGLSPSVEQRSFTRDELRGWLRPVLVPAPGFGTHGTPSHADAVTVHQDAVMYAGMLGPAGHDGVRLRHGYGGYVFAVHGSATLYCEGAEAGVIDEGGAAKIVGCERVELRGGPDGAEVLLVETRVG